MTSEKQSQNFHTDDASLPRSWKCFWLVEAIFPRRTTNQKHHPVLGNDTSSVWNFCALFNSQTSFHGETSDGAVETATAMRTTKNSINLNSKKTNLHAQHTFSLPLFCTTTMPFCTTKTWNFLVMEELSYVLTKNFVACFPVRFYFFSLPLIFTLLAAKISHFLTAAMKYSRFSFYEIRLLCF